MDGFDTMMFKIAVLGLFILIHFALKMTTSSYVIYSSGLKLLVFFFNEYATYY